MNKKSILILGVVGLVLLFLGIFIGTAFNKPTSFAGLVHNMQEIFAAGIKFSTGQGRVGTGISEHGCSAATTWNPASVASTTIATTSLTVTGVALGDQVSANIATSTQNLVVSAYVSAVDAVMVTMTQPETDASAINITTTTVQACYWAH